MKLVEILQTASFLKMRRAAFMRSACYVNNAAPWLFDPRWRGHDKFDPGIWNFLRANPGVKVDPNGGYGLVPR
jgi:hypothetical protein